MLQVVIVEDELHSRETLRNLLNEYCTQVEIMAMAATLTEGVHAIKTKGITSFYSIFIDRLQGIYKQKRFAVG